MYIDIVIADGSGAGAKFVRRPDDVVVAELTTDGDLRLAGDVEWGVSDLPRPLSEGVTSPSYAIDVDGSITGE